MVWCFWHWLWYGSGQPQSTTTTILGINMSGFTGLITLASFGSKALKLLQTLADIFKTAEAKKAGATEQREGDLKDEIQRNANARDAALDPALDDPAGVLTDSANRFGKG